MIEINNIKIPTPSSFKVGIEDISNAERNAKGDLLIDRIATKRKIELGWKTLKPDELSKVLQLVDKTTFFVRYPDPMTGGLVTKVFYCGPKSVPIYSYVNGIAEWTNISFNLIET
jgi:hypothetical protein